MVTSFDQCDTRPRVQQAPPLATQEAVQRAEQRALDFATPQLDWDDEDTLPGCVIEGFAPGTFAR